MQKKQKFYFAAGILVLFLSASAFTAASIFTLPKIEQLADYQPPQVSRMYDRNGIIVAEFFTEKRTIVPIEQIPAVVKMAFLAAEDADFYHHNGIDYGGLTRAIFTEIKHAFLGGRRVGGSTITQQAARTLLLSSERTYTRKIKEIILARRIEESLTKDEILGLYLNQIYFGSGVYGIQEAARYYYGVDAKNLSLSQAAALASVPKSPNRINPGADQERLRERRAYVLKQMQLNNFISAQQEAKANKESIIGKSAVDPYLNQAPFYAEAVRRKLIEMLGPEKILSSGLSIYAAVDIKLQIKAQKALRDGLRQVDKRQGYRGPILRLDPDKNRQLQKFLASKKATLFAKDPTKIWNLAKFVPLYNSGVAENSLVINTTTLTQGLIIVALVKQIDDTKLQVAVDLGSKTATLPFSRMNWARAFNPTEYTRMPIKPSDVLKVGDLIEVRIVDAGEKLLVDLEQTPLAEAALIAIDPASHEVVAMVGGYDFNTSKFNRATQAKRQTGSSIKPFIYAAAIDKEIVTPATIITDAPKVYSNGSEDSQWRPNNNDRQFLGDITVRTCLLKSVNTCSISLLESLGIGDFLRFTKEIDINTPLTPFPRDLTIALGSADVTPLNFVNAYTIFPNQGSFALPIIINKVKSATGEILFEAKDPVVTEVLSPQSAYITTNILQGYMTPTVRQYLPYVTQPLAGKTGTSNEWRNAWFVGYSPELVAGAYVGFDDNKSLGKTEFGIRAAMPIWAQFMNDALKNRPYVNFTQPEGIVWRAIDEKTGLLANDSPGDKSNYLPLGTIMEAFIEGTEPTDAATVTEKSSFGFFDTGPNF